MPQLHEGLFDRETERMVLGCSLLRVEHTRRLVEELEASDFTDRGRRVIFRALVDYLVSHEGESSPWTIADTIDEEILLASNISRADIRGWAGTGGEISTPFFEQGLKKLRDLRRLRDIQNALTGLQSIDPARANEDARSAIEQNLRRLTESYDAVFSNGSGGTLREVSLMSALADPEPIPWAIHGYLVPGDIGILAGDGGVGKSWLLLDLALALASGGTWLAQEVVNGPYKVLVIDEENNHRLLNYRIRKWAHGKDAVGNPDSYSIRYLAENGLRLDSDRGYRRACAFVDEWRPDWIMLDSLVRFHSRNENSNSEMSSFFEERLKPLARRQGSGLLALHHLGKPSKERGDDIKVRLRGASDLGNMVDQLFGLEKDRETKRLSFTHEKTRWGSTQPPLKVEIIDTHEGQGIEIRCTGRADDAAGTIARMLAESESGGCRRRMLVDACEEEGVRHAERAVSRALQRFVQSGEIATRREGRETRVWLVQFAPPDAEGV